MSSEAHFKLRLTIGVKKLLWCARALSSFRLGVRCGHCYLASHLWQPTPRTVTATAGSYRHWLENLLAPAKHRLCVLHPSWMCCRTFFQHDTFLDMAGAISGLARGSQRQWIIATDSFTAAEDNACAGDGGRCQTLCDKHRTLCVGCALAGFGVLLVVAVAWGYIWMECKLCELFLPHPICSRTNLDVSK